MAPVLKTVQRENVLGIRLPLFPQNYNMDITEILKEMSDRLHKPRAPTSVISLLTDFHNLLKEEIELKDEEPWLKNWNRPNYWRIK